MKKWKWQAFHRETLGDKQKVRSCLIVPGKLILKETLQARLYFFKEKAFVVCPCYLNLFQAD